MSAGRPSIFDPVETILKARDYISKCVDLIEEYHKTRGDKSDGYERLVRVRLPTIEGLAVHLEVSRSTLYLWRDQFEEFSDIIEQLQAIQADRLLNNGLSGDYNPTIAKVLLTKHGYVDRQDTDVTSGGEKIQQVLVKFIDDKSTDSGDTNRV